MINDFVVILIGLKVKGDGDIRVRYVVVSCLGEVFVVVGDSVIGLYFLICIMVLKIIKFVSSYVGFCVSVFIVLSKIIGMVEGFMEEIVLWDIWK